VGLGAALADAAANRPIRPAAATAAATIRPLHLAFKERDSR
jgi:hypothetical protein